MVLLFGNLGAIAGITLSERLLRTGVSGRTILVSSGTLACLALIAWIAAPDLITSTIALAVLGGSVAPLWFSPLVERPVVSPGSVAPLGYIPSSGEAGCFGCRSPPLGRAPEFL